MVAVLDVLGDGLVFLFLRLVDGVRMILTDHVPMRGNDDDFEVIDLTELDSLGVGSTGHAREFVIHAEIVLEGNGSEGLVLGLDLDVLLGFNGLMQTVGKAATGHEAAGEFIDEHDLIVLDDVFDILLEAVMRLDRLIDMMLQRDVLRIKEVVHVEHAFDLFHTCVGEGDGLGLFVEHEITVGHGFLGLRGPWVRT